MIAVEIDSDVMVDYAVETGTSGGGASYTGWRQKREDEGAETN